jgi:hypothetical protein
MLVNGPKGARGSLLSACLCGSIKAEEAGGGRRLSCALVKGSLSGKKTSLGKKGTQAARLRLGGGRALLLLQADTLMHRPKPEETA